MHEPWLMHVHGLVIRCDSYTDTHSPDVNRMGQPGSHESVRLLPALEVLFAQLVRPVQQRLSDHRYKVLYPRTSHHPGGYLD